MIKNSYHPPSGSGLVLVGIYDVLNFYTALDSETHSKHGGKSIKYLPVPLAES